MTKQYTRKESLVLREVAGKALLIPVSGETADLQRIYSLNPVATCIWSSLTTTKTADELLDAVLSEFDVPEAEARRDLDAFLSEMLDAHMIRVVETES